MLYTSFLFEICDAAALEQPPIRLVANHRAMVVYLDEFADVFERYDLSRSDIGGDLREQSLYMLFKSRWPGEWI